MPGNRNRKRPIQVKFFVDEKELSLIKARMAQLGIENMSAYLRKMAIDGYASKPDLLAIDQLVSEYGEQFTAEEAQYAIDNLK